MRRFFVESLAPVGATLRLSGDEAHHVLTVTRVRVGEEAALFDGSGREATARVIEARRREAVLQVLDVREVNTEPARGLTIACSVPRSARMDMLVEKCCELGVARLVPMVTARSVVDPMERQGNHLQRWRRHAIEAAKQCGRTRLTEITPAVSFEEALRNGHEGTRRIIASPSPEAMPIQTFSAALEPDAPVTAYVGPEGGFTPEEEARALAAGCTPVSLGPRILRVETAAIALAAYFLLGG